MKIQKLAINIFGNPLGNILAIINLTMLTAVLSGSIASHSFTNIAWSLSGPALVVSALATGSLTSFAIVPLLVYLQWIAIAAFARSLAAEIRPPGID